MTPPPFVPAIYGARVTMVYATPVKETTNNFWVEGNVNYDDEGLEQICTLIAEVWPETLVGVHPTTTRLVKIRAQAMNVEDGAVFEQFLGTGIAGTGAGNPIPLNACMTVTLRTGQAGKSKRGRLYHAGAVQENMASRIAFNTAATDAVTLAYTSFLGSMNSGLENGGKIVVCSKRHDNAWRSAALMTPVSSVAARTKIATQRDRVNP